MVGPLLVLLLDAEDLAHQAARHLELVLDRLHPLAPLAHVLHQRRALLREHRHVARRVLDGHHRLGLLREHRPAVEEGRLDVVHHHKRAQLLVVVVRVGRVHVHRARVVQPALLPLVGVAPPRLRAVVDALAQLLLALREQRLVSQEWVVRLVDGAALLRLVPAAVELAVELLLLLRARRLRPLAARAAADGRGGALGSRHVVAPRLLVPHRRRLRRRRDVRAADARRGAAGDAHLRRVQHDAARLGVEGAPVVQRRRAARRRRLAPPLPLGRRHRGRRRLAAPLLRAAPVPVGPRREHLAVALEPVAHAVGDLIAPRLVDTARMRGRRLARLAELLVLAIGHRVDGLALLAVVQVVKPRLVPWPLERGRRRWRRERRRRRTYRAAHPLGLLGGRQPVEAQLRRPRGGRVLLGKRVRSAVGYVEPGALRLAGGQLVRHGR